MFKSFSTLCALGIFVVLVNCSADALPCEDTKTCATAGPTDDGGLDGGPGPVCDASKDPSCVTNDSGFFVDTGGSDGAAGTKEAPLKTIGAAVAKAGGAKSNVFICAGTYPEHVKLTSAVNLVGGFACGSWAYMAGIKPKVAPADVGYALAIQGSTATTVQDLSLESQAGSAATPSSVAAFVANSASITFRRVSLLSGAGIDAPAPAAASTTLPAASGGTGGSGGGAETSNPVCATSKGGAGGAGGASSKPGADGKVLPATVYPDGNNGAHGDETKQCNLGGAGSNGSFGSGGAQGVGATATGSIDAMGWKGADGAPGGAGTDGQGGGGGAQRSAGAVGGGGAPGGCGGHGGVPGAAGGSSIGVVLFQSTASFDETEITTSKAGRGGDGGVGQVGQSSSGTTADPSDALGACSGGAGGVAGSGGGGGGGSGGNSVGIAYVGTAPTVAGSAQATADSLPGFKLGEPGVSGKKGAGGASARVPDAARLGGKEGTDGVAGISKAVLRL